MAGQSALQHPVRRDPKPARVGTLDQNGYGLGDNDHVYKK
jgi:hypothetical protein